MNGSFEHSASRAVDWVDLLPHVLPGYNYTRHSITGYTCCSTGASAGHWAVVAMTLSVCCCE